MRLSQAADSLIILPQKRFFVKLYFFEVFRFLPNLEHLESLSHSCRTFSRLLVLFASLLAETRKSFFCLIAWRSNIIPHHRPDVNTFLLLFSSFFFSLQKSSPGRPPTPPLRPRPQRLPLPRGDYGAIYYIYIICKQGGPNHDPYRQSRQHPHHHWRLRAR